jgi:predicted RNA-binding protein with PUA-like domain
LRAMKKGDEVLFYHSVTGKDIVGIAKVKKEAYPDPTAKEGDWAAVDLVPVKALAKPVSLETLKSDKEFKGMVLLTHSRLSVSPVTREQYERLMALAGMK